MAVDLFTTMMLDLIGSSSASKWHVLEHFNRSHSIVRSHLLTVMHGASGQTSVAPDHKRGTCHVF